MKIEKLELDKLDVMYGIKSKLLAVPDEAVYMGSMLGVLYPAESTTRHAHHDHEQFIIVKGCGVINSSGQEEIVDVGDVIVFLPGEDHKLHNNSNAELIFVSVWWAFSSGADVAIKKTQGTLRTHKKRLIITPPPTPNGNLHLGHMAGPYIAADILKRYFLQQGEQVLYFTGSDDHQSYVALEARRSSSKPEEVAQKFSDNIIQTLKKFAASPDVFYRPIGNDKYIKYVQNFFMQLEQRNVIQAISKDQPFCVQCDRWLFEAHVGGTCPHCDSPCGGGGCESCGIPNDVSNLINGFCKQCKSAPEPRQTTQMYLALEDYAEQLKERLDNVNLPAHVRELVRGILARPLADIAVTYHSDWGIDAPFEDMAGQKLCSWCEMAPAYLFATQDMGTVLTVLQDWDSAWTDHETEINLFFGFDNSYFYTIIMPILHLAFDPAIKLPNHFIYNEFYLFEDSKFSTSRGHAVWANEVIEKVPSDVLRYYLATTRPEETRTQFTYSQFIDLVNRDLAHELSSWITDISTRIECDFDNICPDGGEWSIEHERFALYLHDCLEVAERAYNPVHFSPANIAHSLRGLVFEGRKLSSALHFLRSGTKASKLEYRTGIVFELTALKYYALIVMPIMPDFAQRICTALGLASMLSWDNEIRLIPKDTPIKGLSLCVFSPLSMEQFI